MKRKYNAPAVMKAKDLFDPNRIQIFDLKTGEYLRTDQKGLFDDIGETQPEPEPEKIPENQLSLF